MKLAIKEKFINFKEMIKKLFEKYPLTLILIYIVTFFFAILMDTSVMRKEWIQKLFMFGAIWGIGAFFAENLFEKGKKRIGLYILTSLISYIFVHFAFINKYEDIVVKWLVCYIVTICAVSLYSIIKKSEKDFSEYVLKVAINIVKSSFIYGILASGVAIILFIFDALILDATSKYISNIEILIAGFFYSTEIIYSLINLEEEVHKFFKNLVKYVLMPLLISAFIIIYLYIIKILVLRDIPKNTIFRIATGLFLIGGFIWTVMNYFKEEGLMYKISTKLPIVFSPFIILQIYTLSVRISQKGMTPLRYAGIVFIIFEICYILCYIFKNKKIQNLIFVADALLIISILIPGINAFDVSDFSQIKILKQYTTKVELTDKEKTKVYGAYYYLKYTDKGKDYIDKNLSDEQVEKIKTYNKSNSRYSDINYISLNSHQDINITGYNKLTEVEDSQYESGKIEQIFSKVELNHEFEIKAIINLADKINEYKNIYENITSSQLFNEYDNDKENQLNNYFEKNNEIIINQNQKFIIKYINIRYNTSTDEIESYRIEGYLLEK